MKLTKRQITISLTMTIIVIAVIVGAFYMQDKRAKDALSKQAKMIETVQNVKDMVEFKSYLDDFRNNKITSEYTIEKIQQIHDALNKQIETKQVASAMNEIIPLVQEQKYEDIKTFLNNDYATMLKQYEDYIKKKYQ